MSTLSSQPARGWHHGRIRRRSDCPHARCSCGRNRWCHLRRQTPRYGNDGDLVRASYGEVHTLRYDVVGDFAQYAADGKFTIPVAKTFALDAWRSAVEMSQSGRAHGKLILLPVSD
nr:zinc-binding dehydrogenase [Paenibacillus hamazuiensis]